MIRLPKNTLYLTGLVGLLACMWTGCSQAPDSVESAGAPSLDALFVEERPANVMTVLQARESVQPGDVVHITGQIGGSTLPFAEGYAAFIIADESLVFCSEDPGDSCSTPWDACCETPEKISASRAMVQFTDAVGNPVAVGLKGQNGLTELDHVIVTGIVNAQSTTENLIIDGQTLHLTPAE